MRKFAWAVLAGCVALITTSFVYVPTGWWVRKPAVDGETNFATDAAWRAALANSETGPVLTPWQPPSGLPAWKPVWMLYDARLGDSPFHPHLSGEVVMQQRVRWPVVVLEQALVVLITGALLAVVRRRHRRQVAAPA